MRCDYCEHKGLDPVTKKRWWCVPLMQFVDTRPANCPRKNDHTGPCHNVIAVSNNRSALK
jgi:hypothetical protein